MGKARILEAHGEGRYTIEIIEARERAEAAKQQAQARITQLTTEISALNQQIGAAQSEADSAAAAQNAAINQYQQEMAATGESSVNLEEFATKLLESASRRDMLRTKQRGKQLRIAADEALIARVDALPPLRQMQAWCADYTEDLSGEVATAEVPGEISNVIIKPGFEGGSQWSAATDGAMQPALAGTPASVFYNLAMQPGWQKWCPTYRTATITSIDGDTCSITLDDATSRQQGLGVNAQSSYDDVPILYMNCDGEAFEEGDKVLIAFAGNVDGPIVVGFEEEPIECNLAIDTTRPGYLGGVGSYSFSNGNITSGIVLKARRSFQINRLTHSSALVIGPERAAAILRLDSTLKVTNIVFIKWGEWGQDNIEGEFNPAIHVSEGEIIALMHIECRHSDAVGGATIHYAYRNFRYEDFAEYHKRHVEVIRPSMNGIFGAILPRAQMDVKESEGREALRNRFEEVLAGSQLGSLTQKNSNLNYMHAIIARLNSRLT